MLVEEAILGRRSVKVFDSRPVPRSLIEQCLSLAIWAPNHKLTEPWRFSVVTGEARAELSHRVHQDLKASDPPISWAVLEAASLKHHRKIHSAPVIIVVYALQDDDSLRSRENYAATAAAIENLLLAAHSLELGAIWRTGSIFEGRHVREFLHSPPRSLFVGAVYLGYSAQRDTPRRRTEAQSHTYWVPVSDTAPD
ncbi:MAG: nitroreductase [Firmicutes bacterium]|uniref:Putative NAD(P)H nitroreductase n=1 Tax=Sulfobacillus benefaciens TaxID=453960 RepID=A0A2T2X9J0_9FIRM|nr:nitroreductase [Bacillota bacterium]MCL5013156.1 nitroreductase [Bacillota bacterium]PSR31149.1 MAG: nitroreductase [Sulfobacillus benefaciens]